MTKWLRRLDIVTATLCLFAAAVNFSVGFGKPWWFTTLTCWNAFCGGLSVYRLMFPTPPSDRMIPYLDAITRDIDDARRLGVPHQWMIDYRRRKERVS